MEIHVKVEVPVVKCGMRWVYDMKVGEGMQNTLTVL